MVAQVYLKDPLADLARYPDDILVADDHVEGAFDPYTATGEANIGTLVMRPTPGTREFMQRWLQGREAKKWDQQHFGITAKIFVAMQPEFRLRTLDVAVYPFACPQAPGCGHALACNIAKYDADWRSSCSPHITANWVSLHLVSCLCPLHRALAVPGAPALTAQRFRYRASVLMGSCLARPAAGLPRQAVRPRHGGGRPRLAVRARHGSCALPARLECFFCCVRLKPGAGGAPGVSCVTGAVRSPKSPIT